LLTASAAVLGLVPLALGITVDFVGLFRNLSTAPDRRRAKLIFWNILAWTIIFGLTFSTLLTLIMVPCMYYVNERIRDKWFRKGKKRL
jgi:multidrug efflux pump